MFASEEEGEEDEPPSKPQERRKDGTSPPPLPSNERRSEASLRPTEERRELLVNKEAEQGMEVTKELDKAYKEFNIDEHEHSGDQAEFSQQVQGLIQGLEDISQHQPLVVPSEVEDD